MITGRFTQIAFVLNSLVLMSRLFAEQKWKRVLVSMIDFTGGLRLAKLDFWTGRMQVPKGKVDKNRLSADWLAAMPGELCRSLVRLGGRGWTADLPRSIKAAEGVCADVTQRRVA